jgi:glycosyltransferase involved in cell wall biosynthesis
MSKFKDKENSKLVYFVGVSNFPFGLAEIQRLILISKALILENYDVTVLSYKFTLNQNLFKEVLSNNEYEGIKYIYSAGKSLEKCNFLHKTFLKSKGKLKELNNILKRSRTNKELILFVSSKDIFHILSYYLVSKICKIKCVLNYVEFYSVIQQSEGLRNSINNYFFDRLTYKFSDGIIPISTFLENYLQNVHYCKPILKIPVICDLNRFSGKNIKSVENYFCYCGSTNYTEVVEFVIDSFYNIRDKKDFKLYLIVSGDQKKIKLLKENTAQRFANSEEEIMFFQNVSNTELEAFFTGAKALLIPLRKSLQDIARFPHKIGEYTASGVPIISTKIGEVELYFKDMENAFLTNEFDIADFSSKMSYIIDNPDSSKIIGEKGKELCKKLFDYSIYSEPLDKFIKSL